MSETQFGQLVLLLTTLAGFIVTAWREQRNRKWAHEDRVRSNRELIERAEVEARALLIETEAIAEAVRLETRLASTRTAETLRLETMRLAETLRVEARTATTEAARVFRTEAETIAGEVREENAVLASGVQAVREEGVARLEERMATVLQAADKAYKEANNVNAKIERISTVLATHGTAIAGVHDAADKAYKEANHVNLKIEKLNSALVEQNKATEKIQGESEGKLDRVVKTGDSIELKVDDLKQAKGTP